MKNRKDIWNNKKVVNISEKDENDVFDGILRKSFVHQTLKDARECIRPSTPMGPDSRKLFTPHTPNQNNSHITETTEYKQNDNLFP
jgi:hypothetical protein